MSSDTTLNVTINGETRAFAPGLTLSQLLGALALNPAKIALERNREIVPRSSYDAVRIAEGDDFEIVHFIGGGNAPIERTREGERLNKIERTREGERLNKIERTREGERPSMEMNPVADKPFTLAGKTYGSRLIIGTGKYKDYALNAQALEASGAELVTVAVRRVNLTDPDQPMLVDYIDPKKYTYIPNTAGCFTAEDAMRTLRLAREAGGWKLVKLEVLGDKKTLYPEMVETLRATEILVKDGFDVLVYAGDDPQMAKRLENLGAAAIMPLVAPIGSGLGVLNPVAIRVIVENATIPVIVDAGIGCAADAAIAMELGCDGVLTNTAIAGARDPVMMARAMRHAVEAGRLSYLAGRMPKKRYADPSSPLGGLI